VTVKELIAKLLEHPMESEVLAFDAEAEKEYTVVRAGDLRPSQRYTTIEIKL
jgi:hypothetical protein